MGFNLPDISLDPSKIKDRWGLGALAFIVWLIIANQCLSNPNLDKFLAIVILLLTIMIILLVLSITVNPTPLTKPSEKMNIPSQREYTRSEDMPTTKEFIYVHKIIKLTKHPEIKKILKEEFKNEENKNL